jgi:ankyrin repeat protein
VDSVSTLVRYSERLRPPALTHLMNRNFEVWLTEAKRQVFASFAEDARLRAGMPDLDPLTLFLSQCRGRQSFGEAIVEATRYGDLQNLETLLRDDPTRVFSKDDAGYTPLHHAARKGQTAMAELLLSKGAEVDAKNNMGYTPLHHAASTQVAALLLENGAHVNGEVVEKAICSGDLEKLKTLLKNDPQLALRKYPDGRTLLHLVAEGGGWFIPRRKRYEMAELLLANGADVNAKAIGGRTPLHYAKSSDNGALEEWLLLNGADIIVDPRSQRDVPRWET